MDLRSRALAVAPLHPCHPSSALPLPASSMRTRANGAHAHIKLPTAAANAGCDPLQRILPPRDVTSAPSTRRSQPATQLSPRPQSRARQLFPTRRSLLHPLVCCFHSLQRVPSIHFAQRDVAWSSLRPALCSTFPQTSRSHSSVASPLPPRERLCGGRNAPFDILTRLLDDVARLRPWERRVDAMVLVAPLAGRKVVVVERCGLLAAWALATRILQAAGAVVALRAAHGRRQLPLRR